MRITRNKLVYNFSLIALIVAIIFGNILTIHLMGTRVRFGEILLILIYVVLFFNSITKRLNRNLLYLFGWMLLSVVLIIFSIIVNSLSFKSIFNALIYLLRFVLFVHLSYLLASFYKKEGQTIKVIKIVNYCYLIVCLIGFFQLVFYPVAFDWYGLFGRFGVSWDGDPHINRIVSTDFDPNYLSCCLLIGLCSCLYLFGHEIKTHINRKHKIYLYQIKYIIFIAIYLLTIFLTKSRSGLLGAVIIFSIMILGNIDLTRVKLSYILGFLVIIGLGIYFIGFSHITVFERIRTMFDDASAGARLISLQKGINIANETYYLGIGYNLLPQYVEATTGTVNSQTGGGLDSSFILILVTTGIVGLIVFLFHQFSLLKLVKRNYIAIGLIIASIIICNFNNLLFYSLWVCPFYLFVFLQSPKVN